MKNNTMKNTKLIITAILFLAIGIFAGKMIFTGKTTEKIESHTKAEHTEEHWTCSMHPQIDMPEAGQCPICGMDLIPKEKGSDQELDPNRFKMTKTAIALANIQTFTIGNSMSSMDKSMLNLSGKIVKNDNNTSLQTAHFGGRVEKLYYRSEGEYIKKGSLLALIYSPELVTAQNELIQALEVKEEQPELYNSVRKKLLNWKLTENQVNELERTKGIITNFKMYASVGGIITKKFVEEGDHVNEGTKMFEVLGMGTVWAEFDVFERDIAMIKKGMAINITSNAYPNKKIKAKINFIDPLLDSKTRTVKVRATVRNPNYTLKPGMIVYASVNIKSTSKQMNNTIVVPKTAVMWTGKRSIVYVKPDFEQPIFELKEVELGKDLGNNYEIISGLEQGEEVVTNGTFTLDAAAQLQGKASMMNPTADAGQKGIEMKCAAGKCGDGMKKEGKNLKEKSDATNNKEIQGVKKSNGEEMKCGSGMKCGEGKCGGGMKDKNEKGKGMKSKEGEMKCGEGKCGSSK